MKIGDKIKKPNGKITTIENIVISAYSGMEVPIYKDGYCDLPDTRDRMPSKATSCLDSIRRLPKNFKK